MPTPEAILNGLRQISNDWMGLAVAWHAFFGAIAVALLLGKRPEKSVLASLLVLPLLSVSAMALISGNPFNGLVFGVSALFLGGTARRMPEGGVVRAPVWAVVAGSLLFAFGWAYPHFLDGATPWTYLYAAPTGLIPCPTLSALIGISLIVGGFESRRWSATLIALGLLYGFIGAVRLGVQIDWVLVAGAVALAAQTLRKS